MKPKVLLIDDDEDILDLLKYNLVREGFEVTVVGNSTESLHQAFEFKPDLIVLDLIMPEINGIDICRQIRKSKMLPDVYIFFLTGMSDDYYRQATYNVGGDDCIEKVTGIKPLLNKIHAVLKKRLVIRKQRMKLKAGAIELHRGGDTAYLNGSKLPLSQQEFEILFFLAQNAGHKFTVSEIINTVWGSEIFIDHNTVNRFMTNLLDKTAGYVSRKKRTELYRFRA